MQTACHLTHTEIVSRHLGRVSLIVVFSVHPSSRKSEKCVRSTPGRFSVLVNRGSREMDFVFLPRPPSPRSLINICQCHLTSLHPSRLASALPPFSFLTLSGTPLDEKSSSPVKSK
ncbi:hypothetical protein NPIL_314401 [Nephila pilipes]|uniref:Uncharacterized protein n=1 Tax=Nephila pilipes TaxID=299642 RepID=A0A8X6PHF9_NEPPI|nr:hypothetical protein NPIL_314401 [Nephila pilipes]